ncbi:MAG: tRNA (N(6)-L-threonylcarbamoyladenosine(37)-C(2))-methylthiotransferase MtaB [bacterium]|nr:tRNA (N(6)-L-threonylcarbamoyladenosine(37)-C(2))-methylthiotransferase MtaB [bacterium]
MRRISFYNQGCRLNQAETATLARHFEAGDYQVVDFKNESDVVVVNTCTVTENGDADTRRLVNKISRVNPRAKIALVGCQAQILREKLFDLPNVRWVVGNAEKMNLVRILDQYDPLNHPDTGDSPPQLIAPKIGRQVFTSETAAVDKNHTRANLKIQDGCDFYCSFCVIPFARGPARSRQFDDIIREAETLAAHGHKEIVLTGINLGTYQQDGRHLLDVIRALEQVPQCERIRISSIEPTTIPHELIAYMRDSEKLCSYLHIPLQSGSDTMLDRMKRKYNVAEFDRLIRFAYDTVPDICIGTDVIVGFPGESETCFLETEDYLRESPIHYFHVFSYSQRQMARSRKFDEKTDPRIIKQRSARLRDLSQRKRRIYMEGFQGKERTVLFEEQKHGYWTGLTDNYMRVKVHSSRDLKNQFHPVQFNTVENQCLTAQLSA